MPISKLQASQQQLDCAIRLLFNLDDMPSVITLSRAAFRVLFDIYRVLKPEGDFGDALSRAIKGMGWTKFNEIANQLKHADNDANAMIDPHPIHAMVGIGLAITLYHQLTSSRTPEMQAFETLMSMLEPDVFAGPPDPEAEGYADFMKAAEHMQDATHEQLMEFGRGSLHYLKTGKVEASDPRPPKKI
jgi:hypothetical protein